MPAGNDVDYVWRTTGTVGSHMEGTPGPTGSDRRVCLRSYYKQSDPFDGAAVNCGMKLMELQINSVGSLQVGNGGRTDGWNLRWSAGLPGGGNNLDRTSDLTLSSFNGIWGRVEICLSMGTGNFGSGGDLYGEGRIVRLSDGAMIEWPLTLLESAIPPVTSWDYVWPINNYREPSSGGTCNGSRDWSHAMRASWPTNAGQRIGSALEVEGYSGCATWVSGGVCQP
jgi:hypothetical protein